LADGLRITTAKVLGAIGSSSGVRKSSKAHGGLLQLGIEAALPSRLTLLGPALSRRLPRIFNAPAQLTPLDLIVADSLSA
jgi:hypothetical protein